MGTVSYVLRRRDRPRSDPAKLAALRAVIRRIERRAPGGEASVEAVSFGATEIDAALPWGGLPRGALHEVLGDDGALYGFSATLAARIADDKRPILWCRRGRDLYGPGLAAFGIDTDRLILVQGAKDADILWAMEEALRSGAVAAVLGEVARANATATRRLQLAAERGGGTALLLRPGKTTVPPCPAATRWRIVTAPTLDGVDGVTGPRWQVDLMRCRNGMPRSWVVEMRHGSTGDFVVVTDLLHRPVTPEVGTKGNARSRLRLAG